MSKYTTEVRYICEHLAGYDESQEYPEISEVIEKARPKIFSFKYPIFDEAYRSTLETKILRHFYMREIGQETYALWKFFLENKLNEIMPLYNQLYESERIEFNPLYDADYHRDGEGSDNRTRDRNGTTARKTTLSGKDTQATEGTTTDTSETESRDKYSEWDLYSDTPQGAIAGISGAEDDPSLGDNGYLTNARHILHDGDGTTASGVSVNEEDTTKTTTYGKISDMNGSDTQKLTEAGENEFTHHIYGRLGGRTPAELLLEYRKTFLNIDEMIIKELEPLFFGLW
jgi:hypothetical protein